MGLIKGYVRFYDKKIPVTWEKETKKYAKNVRKVFVMGEDVVIDKRLYDDKVHKEEILEIVEF